MRAVGAGPLFEETVEVDLAAMTGELEQLSGKPA